MDASQTAWGDIPVAERPRKRTIPKGAKALTAHYEASSLDELRSTLRQYLETPKDDPERAVYNVTFASDSIFPVRPPPRAGYADREAKGQEETDMVAPTMMSIREAVDTNQERRARDHKQRAIARACLSTIQRTDGFRYSFHNSWISREDEAFRFSYYCNDSLLNKCRAANSRSATVTQRAKKAVYDCKGVIHVKFCAPKRSVQVEYRHVPIHETYEQRAPPPRPGAKRPRHEDGTGAPVPVPAPLPEPRPKRVKKKKPQPPPKSTEYELLQESLVTLLDVMQPEQEKEKERAGSEGNMIRSTIVPTELWTPNQHLPAACRYCRLRKIRCDGARPACKSCIDRAKRCDYLEDAPAGGRQATGQPNHAASPPNRAANQPTQTPYRAARPSNLPDRPNSQPNRAIDQFNHAHTHLPTSGSLQSTEEPVAQDRTLELTEARTEVELLRAKLLEAEQRIQQFESEQQLQQENTDSNIRHSLGDRMPHEAQVHHHSHPPPYHRSQISSHERLSDTTPATSATGRVAQLRAAPDVLQQHGERGSQQRSQHSQQQRPTPSAYQWGQLYDYAPEPIGFPTGSNMWSSGPAGGVTR